MNRNAGTRASWVVAPIVWNLFHDSVKLEGNNIVSFRRRLRTYLFNATYTGLASLYFHPSDLRMVYDNKIAQSLGFATPVSLIFEDTSV